jgi:asparagine synthase (glutamine-hydrolysing)
MTDLMHHRGPDDGGTYVAPEAAIGLGNRRLAIIDLSPEGHMPMGNDDGTIWMTYNGEVYNFPELRDDLMRRGHHFRSTSDTEVILRLYEAEGTDAFRQLNGMFALAIWDSRQQELLLVRDRFGVKPLYYTTVEGQLLFASEIKSLLLHPWMPRIPDLEAIHYFLAHLWVPGPGTMFQGIFKLPPGHLLRWRAGQYTVRPYWELAWTEDPTRSEAELVAELRAILRRAVARHMIADVPLGLFLSGGLDSSLLLGLMTERTQAPVSAYTIAFRSQDARREQAGGADAYYAELVARHFGADFHRIQVDPDIVALLPRVLWHLDEPVADPAAIATLLIAEAARPQLKVLLSGQGADEVFAGYRVHLADRFSRPLGMLPGGLRNHVLQPLLGTLPAWADHVPGVHAGLVLAVHRYFSKVLAGVELSPEDRYIFHRSYYTQAEALALYRPELRARVAGYDGGRRHRAYFAEVPLSSFTNRMLHVDLKTFLPELNLTYGDKLSMAASIETRVPFLDYELVEFMARVPAHLKVRGVTGKYLLRRAAADLLPRAVVQRRKAGFGAPIRQWLESDLAEVLRDLLAPDRIRRRGYFDPAAVAGLIARNQAGLEDNTYRLWALLTLELWHQIFIDGAGAPLQPAAPTLVLSTEGMRP